MSRIGRQMRMKLLSAISIISLLLSGLVQPVSAAGGTGSIHVVYVVEDAEFALYRLATKADMGTSSEGKDASESGNVGEGSKADDAEKSDDMTGSAAAFQVVPEFADVYEVLVDADAQTLREQALALGEAVKSEERKPILTKSTGADKELKFEELEQGIYLVVGEAKTVDGYTYKPMPTVLFVPMTDVNGVTGYDVTAEIKYDRDKVPETPPETPPTPPETPPETPQTPPETPPETPQTPPETPPTPSTPPEKPKTPPDTTENPPETPSTPPEDDYSDLLGASHGRGGDDSDVENASRGRLPKTGQLWWPVMLMAALGLGFVGAGVLSRKKTNASGAAAVAAGERTANESHSVAGEKDAANDGVAAVDVTGQNATVSQMVSRETVADVATTQAQQSESKDA